MQFTRSVVLNHSSVNGGKSSEENNRCHGNLREQDISKPRITSECGGKRKSESSLKEQIAFTFQVFFLLFTEYLLLRFPKYFQMFYCVMFPFLFITRYFHYKVTKWHYSMLEICYWVNCSTIIQTTWFQNNIMWFKMNYVIAIGPLCSMVCLYNFSLRFHEIDKLISIYLHYTPACVLYLYRWQIIPTTFDGEINNLSFKDTTMSVVSFYLTWYLLFWLITEVVLGSTFRADQELQTSERYLMYVADANPIAKSLAKLTKDILGPLNLSAEIQFKLVYLTSSLIYFLLSSGICYLLYDSEVLTACYLIFIFFCYTWFGGIYLAKVLTRKKIVSEDKTSFDRKFEKLPPQI